MKPALFVLVVAVIALHQDMWNWTNKTLVFGFLPIGLAYHALYSILCVGLMVLLVRFLWPADLDDADEPTTGVEA